MPPLVFANSHLEISSDGWVVISDQAPFSEFDTFRHKDTWGDLKIRRDEAIALIDQGVILDRGPPTHGSIAEAQIDESAAVDEIPQRTGGQGRPTNQRRRGHADADVLIVNQMKKFFDEQKLSVWAAAVKLLPEAAGNGTDDSKAKRLTNLFYKTWPEYKTR